MKKLKKIIFRCLFIFLCLSLCGADNRLPKIAPVPSVGTLDNSYLFIVEKNATKYKVTTDDIVVGISGAYLKLDQTTPQSVINGAPTFVAGLKTGLIYPTADSTSALLITKADGTTPMLTFDTSSNPTRVLYSATHSLRTNGDIKSRFIGAGVADPNGTYGVISGQSTAANVPLMGLYGYTTSAIRFWVDDDDNNGFIGIGTDAPAKLLHLKRTGDCGFRLERTSGVTFDMTTDTTAVTLNMISNAPMKFYTSNTLRAELLNTGVLKTYNGRIKKTTRVTADYTLLATDEVVFVDTDGGEVEITLPAGVEGTHYKLINCGSSGNNVTVTPNGSEKVNGAATQTLYDGDIWDGDYNATEGWWG